MPRVYVWHILEQQLDLSGEAMRIFLCYIHRSGCTQVALASKFLRNCRDRPPGETRAIALRALITSLAAAWEFYSFLFWVIHTQEENRS